MSDLTFEETDLLPDIPATGGFEYACQVCGVELHYAGKGRKPTKCEQHKRSSTPAGSARVKVTGKSDQLARQAAAALVQVNGLLAAVLMVAPMPYRLMDTASALAGASDAFGEQAYAALVTDPKLAALILKGGGTSGKVALVIAYAMLGAAIVPIGINEYRENVKEVSAGGDRPEV